MFNLFKKKTMNKEEIVAKATELFIEKFREDVKNENDDVTEITDDNIRDILKKYFEFDKLSDANKYFSDAFEEFVPDTYEQVNWHIEEEERKKTPEYIQWNRHLTVDGYVYYAKDKADIQKRWVDVNGKLRTNEEAAVLAANKWCELLFDWHLQDNGALNEEHPGGFTACALGTVLANKSKERITDEMKVKTRELFIEYYKRYLHYWETHDFDDIKWAYKTMPGDDPEKQYSWSHGFSPGAMYCDYGPYTPLYLLLRAAGIPESDINCICPWKTGIEIRDLDNAVLYRTYQHTDEL